MPKKKEPFLLKYIMGILSLVMFIKIAGYFAITEVRVISQIYKTLSRVGMTVVIWLILKKLKKLGCIDILEFNGSAPVIYYALYLLLGFSSFMWSTKPDYSALQWFMTFESFVFVYIFYKVVYTINIFYPDKRINLIKIFVRANFPIILTFVIGSQLLPDFFYREMRGGEEIRLGGWIMNPNELGMLASMLGALAYNQMVATKKKKIYSIIVLISALFIVVLTASRSSLLGFLLIIGILILRSDNKALKITMITLMVVVAPIAVKEIVFKEEGSMEEVMSMTGRLPFWTALLQEGIIKEPFLGYGFMRINYTDYFQGLNTYPGRMTHNTFMQILMNLGFIGFFIGAMQVFYTVKNFFKNLDDDYANFFIAVFIPVIINSLTEFGIFGDANYGILFWQFLMFLFVFKQRTFLTTFEKSWIKKLKNKTLLESIKSHSVFTS